MNPLKFLSIITLSGVISVFLVISPRAYATLEESQAEANRLQGEINTLTQKVKDQEARVAKLQTQASSSQGTAVGKEGMGGNVGITEGLGVGLDTLEAKAAKDVLNGYKKQLAKAQRNLQSVQNKITKAQNKAAQDALAKKDADAKAKAKREADAAKLAEENKAKAEADARARAEADARAAKARADRDARIAKAKADSDARARAAEQAAKNAEENKTRTTQTNTGPSGHHEKQCLDAASRASRERTEAVKNYAENPTPENRAKAEAARKILDAKVAELNKARSQADADAGRDARPPVTVKHAKDVLDRLKSEGKLKSSYYRVSSVRDTAKDASQDSARMASRDAAGSAAKQAASEAAKTASKEASKESSKEASKETSKASSKAAGHDAAKSGAMHHSH